MSALSATCDYTGSPIHADKLADRTTFAALVGSNFDAKVSSRISMRFSPGAYITQFGPNQTQKNLRFSVGPVFHFGRES